jgi:Flp pilus assembly protein TadD
LTRWSEASDVYDRAIVLRRQAYEQDKNDAHARRSLAAILYRQGSLLHYNLKKPEAALGPLREASQLWSLDDPVDAQRGETEYELGVACTQLGNLREAEVHRATALAIFTTAAKTGSLESNQKAMFDDLRGPSKDAVAPAARAVR